jgi:hypothetical protein
MGLMSISEGRPSGLSTDPKPMARIGRTLVVALGKFRARLREAGWRRTVASALSTAVSPVLRRRERLIWERKLGPLEPSVWEPGEKLVILGPDNIDKELTEELRSFLGGPAATPEIEGVRGGDRLFVVANAKETLACSYIFFDTTQETRRQARLYGEQPNTPIIGMSFTSPAARGRGLYRRILHEMFRYLAAMNCERAVCEVHPANTPSNKASQAAGMRVCRELCDWAIVNKLFLQRVTESGESRWRVLWV